MKFQFLVEDCMRKKNPFASITFAKMQQIQNQNGYEARQTNSCRI